MRHTILGMELDELDSDSAVATIISWSKSKLGRYVCVSNVHQCMESFDNAEFKTVINNADMVIPDSQVLVAFQHWLKFPAPKTAIRGVELMQRLCHAAQKGCIKVGLYGGAEGTLTLLNNNLQRSFSDLNIVLAISPPFRPLTPKEDSEYIQQINQSGVELLFVGLGCPKQERWMAEHSESIHCVKIGVGAAFDFIAGVTKPSPAWVHPMGLEWLYRLRTEPRRLWQRYFKHNPRFLWHCLQQKCGKKYN